MPKSGAVLLTKRLWEIVGDPNSLDLTLPSPKERV